MLLLRILSSPCSPPCSFFFSWHYSISPFIVILHISCSTQFILETLPVTLQLPRQSRRDSCHISISCCFYGPSVLTFILCHHVPWLSHYSCGNTPGSDIFFTSQREMLQETQFNSEKRTERFRKW